MSTMKPIALRADAPAVVDLPPAHLELSWRPLQLADADPLHGLVQRIESADGVPGRTSADRVRDRLLGGWKDLQRDSLGGFDDTGVLRAYGLVEVSPGDVRTVRAFLTGGVDPRWRGRGLGRAVLAWMEGRGRQRLVETGKDLPARLAVHVEETARDQRRLYAAAGFSPVRWYSTMRRDLTTPLPDVDVPADVRLERWTPELDDGVRLAHNAAVADHWGSEPHSVETWRRASRDVADDWSVVAVAGTQGGAVVGYALAGRHEQGRALVDGTCGYVELLGVRPEQRGRGLGAALLVRSMAAMRDDGVEYACLAVDTADPTGVRGLYERLGFEVTHGQVLYSVEI